MWNTFKDFVKERRLDVQDFINGLNPKTSWAKVENGIITFAANEAVIGRNPGDDPDGGRAIYPISRVSTGKFDVEINYREKWWTGLQAEIIDRSREIPTVVADFSYDPEDWPSWLRQAED